jgi:hypothetical protein
MPETVKCHVCGRDNELTNKECANIPCHAYLKSDLECLRSIDRSIRTIKRIAVWWLILSILGVIVSVLYALIQIR